MEFSNSKTKENLMRAFAGESQAKNRYIFSASYAKKNGFQAIEKVFLFTADQEEAHASVFYKSLKEFAGQTITVDGTYPVDLYDDVAKLLRAAQHNEQQEFEHDYAEFANIAKEEGFNEIATKFNLIAGIEKVHGERFGEIADLLEQGKLFVSDVACDWMCLNCGFIYNGTGAPQKCPACDHPQGYFIRLELAPYTK